MHVHLRSTTSYLQHRCSSSSLQGARSTARSSRRSNNYSPLWRRCRNVPPNARLDGRLALSQKLRDSKHQRVLLPSSTLPPPLSLSLYIYLYIYISISFPYPFCDSLFLRYSPPQASSSCDSLVRHFFLCVFFSVYDRKDLVRIHFSRTLVLVLHRPRNDMTR